MNGDVAYRHAFAEAIAHPDEPQAFWVRTIYNGMGDLVPGGIQDAVESGKSFAVKPDPQVVMLDCDSRLRVDAMWTAFDALEQMGLLPVMVASGQPHHLHMFVRIVDPDVRKNVRDYMSRYVARPWPRYRPPLSPHHKGYPVSIVQPEDWDEALARLTKQDQKNQTGLILDTEPPSAGSTHDDLPFRALEPTD